LVEPQRRHSPGLGFRSDIDLDTVRCAARHRRSRP
jgi:hypothetical protein